MEILKLTALEIREKLINKEITALEITETYLDEIKKDKNSLNAYITLDEEGAISSAKKLDEKVKNGKKLGKLAGLPIGIKDNISTKGLKTTCGSEFLKDYIPPFNASLIKTIKEEDGIILGKNNLDEFAMGSSTESSYYGVTRNPLAIDKVAGGSSGGSAASVAGNQAILSVGTDTGGSVRQPASFCNLVGIKPTYGTISKFGVVPMANSMDQVGVFGRNVKDAAMFLDVLMKYDKNDSTSYMDTGKILRNLDLNEEVDLKGVKIGIPREFLKWECDEGIKLRFREGIEILKSLGAEIHELDMPYLEYGNACYHVLSTAEASSNLARFDGIRYGHRTENYEDLDELYTNSRTETFGFEAKRRITFGTYLLTGEEREKYYIKSLKVRRLIKEDFERAFKEYDLLVSPTTPNLPYDIGIESNGTKSMYDGDKFTIPVNLAGLPAITVPSGKVDGLPTGIQIIGNMYDEMSLIKAALAFEGGIKNGI